MHRRAAVLALAAGIVAFTAGCAQRPSDDAKRSQPAGVPPNIVCGNAACSTYNLYPYVRTRSKYGVGCLGNSGPHGTPNPEPPPQSYRAADIGKPDFPRLRPAEAAMVKRIERYVHAKTLRIAWVDNATTPNGFIVFDALDGECGTSRPYGVLNGTCNEIYEPGENPYSTTAAPGCFESDRHRPWMNGT